MSNLNDKQLRFCQEYIIDLNATQAAIRAGYSEKTAGSQAHDLLKKPEIQENITKEKKAREKRTQIDADWVLKASKRLHDKCMQDVRPVLSKSGEHVVGENPETGEEGLLYTFNAAGAAKAIDLIGKHVNIQAFNEKTSVEIVDKSTVLQKARKRASASKDDKS